MVGIKKGLICDHWRKKMGQFLWPSARIGRQNSTFPKIKKSNLFSLKKQLWNFFIKKKIVGMKKGLICDHWKKIWMISDFYSIFESPPKILGKKIKICRNFDECNFQALGSKLLMATKSRILKLECFQATWTFIDNISQGRSKEISQKQSSLLLL